ncbi:MAG TPA: TonB-dependent receptor [Polyangiaceae bacterium]|nr:TonB-dependent receptor [Polyangiaceae bacterium]
MRCASTFTRALCLEAAIALLVSSRLEAQPSAEAVDESMRHPSTQGAPAPSEPPLIPPEPLETPLAYPEDGAGAAIVVVELTIDASGKVTDTQLIEGEPPFAEAALSAARAFRFEPARRAGRPVPVRIRYTLHFTPEEPESEPPPRVAEPGAPPPVEPAAPADPVEIVIHGERPPPGTVTITREEARMLPGTFGDPVRAIESQPGVVPIVSGLPAFFIRGAPPANVGFFIDGVDVPLLFHAFFGPSVLHPGIIDGIDFYPGAAPVRYGRFAGPVVALRSSPLTGRTGGEASVRLIDAGALLETGFGGGGAGAGGAPRSAVRVGGRYSYAGLVLSLLSDAELDYWDYQAQARLALGDDEAISFFAFGAYDLFRPPSDAENTGGEVEFHRADVRYTRRLGASTELSVAVTAGYDRAGGAVEDASVVDAESLRARAELNSVLSESATLFVGVDGRIDRFGLETNPAYLSYPDYSALFPERTESVVGAYVEAELQPTRSIRVTPGVRADVYRGQGVTVVGVDPRISAEFELRRAVVLEHSFGILHQRPNFAAQVPGAQVADLAGGLQQALLFSSGVRFPLPGDLSASATVFRSAYFRALDPIGGGRDFTIDRTLLDRRATVSAAGLELRISRPLTRRLGGFLGYTLSRSEQTVRGRKAVSGFDRPHVLQGALGYDFGNGFRGGVRAIFYSGVPALSLEGSPTFTDSRRGRPYFRADLRFEKRFRLGEAGYWGIIAEVLNATSTREVVRLDCGELCRERSAGPVVLPSLGVEAAF